jgi:hypothetical protein
MILRCFVTFFLSPTSFYLTMVRCRGVIAFDHTQWHATVGRTPLDEGSARRRDLYLTTHNTHNGQPSMSPAGFEPTISAGDRPRALDRSAPGIGMFCYCCSILEKLKKTMKLATKRVCLSLSIRSRSTERAWRKSPRNSLNLFNVLFQLHLYFSVNIYLDSRCL